MLPDRPMQEFRICPRCKASMEVELFVPPVRICMVCYSQIPANLGLSPQELFAKAGKSRWAKYNSDVKKDHRLRAHHSLIDVAINRKKLRLPKADVQGILDVAAGRAASHDLELEPEPEGHTLDEMTCNCDLCGVEIKGIREPVKRNGEVLIICDGCV